MLSKLKITSACLSVLIACIAIVILGLSANSISYVNTEISDFHNYVTVHYIWQNYDKASKTLTKEPRTEDIQYTPDRFTMKSAYTLLAIGIFGTMVGLIAVTIEALDREERITISLNLSGRRVSFTDMPTVDSI